MRSKQGLEDMKSEIIEQLGQSDLLLPALIAEGLAANDRVKIRLSVLQAAARHARDPKGSRFDLTGECRAAGIDPVAVEALVNGASLSAGGRISRRVSPDWARDLGRCRGHGQAVKAADAAQAITRWRACRRSKRGAARRRRYRTCADRQADRLSDGDGDSLHRLVMDLHKALNRLAAAHAEEVIAGAHVFGLLPQDRPAVEAFMRGVEATAQVEIRSSRPGDDGGADGDAADDPERHRRNRRACGGDRGRSRRGHRHLHRRASARARNSSPACSRFPVQWSGLERKSAAGLATTAIFIWSPAATRATTQARDAFLEALGACAGLSDRLEQGAQGAARLGFQGRRGPHPRLGGAPSLRSSRLPRTRRRRTGGRRRASRGAGPHRLRRAAGPRARPQRGGRFSQDRAARLAPRRCCRAVRCGWRATGSRRNWSAICSGSTAR